MFCVYTVVQYLHLPFTRLLINKIQRAADFHPFYKGINHLRSLGTLGQPQG